MAPNSFEIFGDGWCSHGPDGAVDHNGYGGVACHSWAFVIYSRIYDQIANALVERGEGLGSGKGEGVGVNWTLEWYSELAPGNRGKYDSTVV